MGGSGTRNGEKVGADVGKVFAQGGYLDMLAGDAQPEATLGKIEGETKAKDEDNSGGPDKQRAAIFGDEEDGGFAGLVEGDGPLFVETGLGLAHSHVDKSFEGVGRGSRYANTNKERWMLHLSKLYRGRM